MNYIGGVVFAAFVLGVLVSNYFLNQNKEHDAHDQNGGDETNIPKWRKAIYSRITQHNRNKHEERHHRNPNIGWTRKTFWVVLTYTTVTLLLLYVNYRQLQESRVSSRAWVGPVSGGAVGNLAFNEPLTVQVKYHDSGREPARDTFYDLTPFIFPDTDEAEADKKVFDYVNNCAATSPNQGASVVYPTSGFSEYTEGRVIDGKDVSWDVIYGRAIIVGMGCFVYRTVNEIHRSTFCFYFQNGGKEMSLAAWAFCHVGNYAD